MRIEYGNSVETISDAMSIESPVSGMGFVDRSDVLYGFRQRDVSCTVCLHYRSCVSKLYITYVSSRVLPIYGHLRQQF